MEELNNPSVTMADLMEAMLSAPELKPSKRPHVQTGFAWLATGRSGQHKKLAVAAAKKVLTEIPARGILFGDIDMKALTGELRRTILESEDYQGKSEAQARHACDNYASCLREALRLAMAQGWPLAAVPATEIPEGAELVTRAKPEPKNPGNVKLPRMPYKYLPWSQEEKVKKSENEDLIAQAAGQILNAREAKEVTRAQQWLDRMDSTRWTPELQPFWSEFERWALIDRTRGLKNRRGALRPATIEKRRGSIGSYAGYLLKVGHVEKGDLDVAAFREALQSEDWLKGYVDWIIERHREIRQDPEYVPLTAAAVVTEISWLVKQFVLPGQGIPAEEVERRAVAALRVRDHYVPQPTPVKDMARALPTIPEVIDAAKRIWQAAPAANSPLSSASMRRDAMMLMAMMFFPLRLRNWRTAKLGINIIRERDGRWRIYFPASEVKNKKPLLCDLDPYLWPWLDEYAGEGAYKGKGLSPREILLKSTPTGRGNKPVTPDLFLPGAGGIQLCETAIYTSIIQWTNGLLDFAMNPHLARDVVATGILKANPDAVVTTAYLLGDTIQTTLARYGHLTQQDAANKAGRMIRRMINEAKTQGDGEGDVDDGPAAGSCSSIQPWPGMGGNGRNGRAA